MREVYVPGHPIDVQFCQSEGEVTDEILRMAGEIGADLIVLGIRGATPLRRLLVGSVASAVLRGARCPVMALRLTDHSSTADKIRVIVHPTDFSQSSESALSVARSLACDLGARLILLHVAPSYGFLEGGMAAEHGIADLSNALESTREKVDGPDLKFPVETWFSRGSAAEGILDLTKEIGCDLIVMGTHARTGLSRLLMGNTAESVLAEACCPVIVVKEPQPFSSNCFKSSDQHTNVDRHPIAMSCIHSNQASKSRSLAAMSVSAISPIENTIHVTNTWLKELMEELECHDRQEAYHALGTVLHALRDRLTVAEAADLGAQLPMLIRGLYYEGWNPNGKPVKERTREAFLRHISAAFRGQTEIYSERVVLAVFRVLQRRVSAGEINDVKHVLPAQIRLLWPEGEVQHAVKATPLQLREPSMPSLSRSPTVLEMSARGC